MMSGSAGPEPGAARSVAATASERVQAILEAAEASAAEIRREAEEEAAAIRERARADAGRASASTETTVRRLEELHAELGALIASLRGGEGEPASAGPEAAGDEDAAGVRLIALNMALDGIPREQAARYLAENFSLGDPEQLLDEVYASVER